MNHFDEICGNTSKIAEIRCWIENYLSIPSSNSSSLNTPAVAASDKVVRKPAKKVGKNGAESAAAATKKSKNVVYGETRQKVLLLIGNSGCGKTMMGDLIFREMGYRPLSLEIGERSLKKMFEQTAKYHNVLQFMGGQDTVQSKVGLWLDDIDILFSDSAVYQEIMEILRTNTFTIPIIASCKETDKKISEFKKYCTEIKFGKCTKQDMRTWLNTQFQKELHVSDPSLGDKWIPEIIQYSNSDFRTIKQIFFELKRSIRLNANYLKNETNISKFFDIYQEKIQEDTTFDSLQKVITLFQTAGMGPATAATSAAPLLNYYERRQTKKKTKIQEGIELCEVDSFLLSSMMNQNYFTLIQEKRKTFREKLEIGANISKNFIFNEKYYSNYNHLNNSLSYQYNILNNVVFPSILLGKSKNVTAVNPVLKYPLIFNKLSQKINNLRYLQNSFSIIHDSADNTTNHYHKFPSFINESSLWSKYYISYLVFHIIQNGIKSIQDNKDRENAANMDNTDDTEDTEDSETNPEKTSGAVRKNDKQEFMNSFIRQKWLQVQQYNISIPNLENWLKYYKILYWNSADDKKILTARKRDVLLSSILPPSSK